jgi:hypothetical protein
MDLQAVLRDAVARNPFLSHLDDPMYEPELLSSPGTGTKEGSALEQDHAIRKGSAYCPSPNPSLSWKRQRKSWIYIMKGSKGSLRRRNHIRALIDLELVGLENTFMRK